MSYEIKNRDHHINIGQEFGDMLTEKTAWVTGAGSPDLVENEHAGIPYETRKRAYMRYVGQKSKEGRTGWGTAMGTGAVIGAGIGGLMGAAGGSTVGGLLGGAIGGGIVGAVAKAGDDAEISQARQATQGGKGVADEILAARMARRQQYEKYQDRSENRANALMVAGAVRSRPSRVNNYNTRVQNVQMSNKTTYNRYR